MWATGFTCSDGGLSPSDRPTVSRHGRDMVPHLGGISVKGHPMPPAWVPRDLLEDPKAFGRPDREAVWIRSPDLVPKLAAAYFHHRVSQSVVAQMETEGRSTLERLAVGSDESVDYVRSKVYGHRPISLEDLMTWVEALGVQILPVIGVAAFEDLLPPADPDQA